MGAPKQKWTDEEESALKAGITKHGVGRWRTILKDPQFSHILYLRSNVDLKDKWRNMNVTANGSGSRGKTRETFKKTRRQYDDNPMALSTLDDFDDDIVDVQPLAVSSGSLYLTGPNESILNCLDELILEAIKSMNEPTGSNKTGIGLHIEATYNPPPHFKEQLSEQLEELTACGKLIKVKHRYRIAPNSAFSKGRNSKALLLDGRQQETSRLDRSDFKALTKSQVDAELARMRDMTEQEAEAAAARAVMEAEAALADAEAAAREAEMAEVEAEAAQAFAGAAKLALKNGSLSKMSQRTSRESSSSVGAQNS